MPNIINKPSNENISQNSPRNTEKSANSKYFLSMQMTPNPLIKNSFASPVKEGTADKYGDIKAY